MQKSIKSLCMWKLQFIKTNITCHATCFSSSATGKIERPENASKKGWFFKIPKGRTRQIPSPASVPEQTRPFGPHCGCYNLSKSRPPSFRVLCTPLIIIIKVYHRMDIGIYVHGYRLTISLENRIIFQESSHCDSIKTGPEDIHMYDTYIHGFHSM